MPYVEGSPLLVLFACTLCLFGIELVAIKVTNNACKTLENSKLKFQDNKKKKININNFPGTCAFPLLETKKKKRNMFRSLTRNCLCRAIILIHISHMLTFPLIVCQKIPTKNTEITNYLSHFIISTSLSSKASGTKFWQTFFFFFPSFFCNLLLIGG